MQGTNINFQNTVQETLEQLTFMFDLKSQLLSPSSRAVRMN
jgi:hypothetical protein